MAGLTRGSVLGWLWQVFVWMGKWRDTQTEVTLEGRQPKGVLYLRDESLETSRRACNKANEETYTNPLLVNINLI